MKETKQMIKVLYEENGTRKVEEIFVNTVDECIFELRAIIGGGGIILGLDRPIETEVEVNKDDSDFDIPTIEEIENSWKK